MDNFAPTHPIGALAPTGIPLYQQVKQAMLTALASGEWNQGDAIPPEKVLSARFNVSIGTLRKAIDDLVSENILVRHQGRGTFVAEHAHNQHFFKFFRIARQDGKRSYPETQLQQFRRLRANGEAQEKLGLGNGAYVYEFINLLKLNGQNVMVDTVTVPESIFVGLDEAQLRERSSTLYRFYQERFGVNVITTDEQVRIVRADPAHSRWLDVPLNEPLLDVRRVAYSYKMQAVEWRQSRVNVQDYEYIGHEAGDR